MNPSSVLALMEVAVLVQDRGAHVLFANPVARELFGLVEAEPGLLQSIDPECHLYAADETLIPPDGMPAAVAIRTGEPVRDVVVGIDRPFSTDRAWMLLSCFPRTGPDGEVEAVLSVMTDISRALQTLGRLTRVNQSLEQITSAVPGVIYQHFVADDGAESFPFVSEQLAAMVGLDRLPRRDDAELIYGLIHPDDRDRLRAAIRKATSLLDRTDPAAAATLLDEEVRLVTRSGEARFVQVRSSGVRRPGGYLFNGFLQDVTERARMAEQLRVAQRKEILADLAAGFGHNFNNLLAAILPNLERARRETTGAVHLEIDDAHQAASSAAELVRQLMLMVRREDPLAREAIDLAAVSRDVIRICRRTFDRRFAITERILDRPIVVQARRGELQQVLLNLCLNARDATEATPEPRIEISLTEVEGSDRVAFTVADNGSGMSEDVRRRAGEPFFTTKPPGRGTGLGLATAIGIVEDLGGTLDFDSTAGAGSIFRVSLPTLPGRSPREVPERALVTTTEFAGLRALVIDDEALVRQVVSRMLRQLGFVAATAADGAEGLARLEAGERFAVAIVDLSMPGMSGTAVLDQIRHHWPELPVLISSGNFPSEIDLTKAAATLQKPYLIPELQAALRAVLDRQPADPPNASHPLRKSAG